MGTRYIGTTPAGAVFDRSRRHRFSLWRRWNAGHLCAFVGLNPSTADESTDDPTVRRCIAFAKRWGFGGMVMLNIFSFRATDPAVMKSRSRPNLEENDDAIADVVDRVNQTVCCWGVHGEHLRRGRDALAIITAYDRPLHLGLTQSGQPRHPLYLAKTTARRPFWDDEIRRICE